MCCSLYDDDMFTQMEWHVLQTLTWSMGHPTVDCFLQMAVLDTPIDPEVEHLALYILEISLFHREFVSKSSADLARAALALARCVLNRPQPRHTEWTAQYDPMTLVDLSQQLHQPSQVVFRKYSSVHFSRVSKILEQFLTRQASIASYTPPVPSSTTPVESKPYNGEIGLATPQKTHLTTAPKGYVTPPITPENADFANANNPAFVKGLTATCPPSPTPHNLRYVSTNTYPEPMYIDQEPLHQPQLGFHVGY